MKIENIFRTKVPSTAFPIIPLFHFNHNKMIVVGNLYYHRFVEIPNHYQEC